MRIDGSGNVGIGAAPTSTLDVRGVVHVGASASTTPVIGRSLAPAGSQGLFLTAGVVNSESTTTPTFADNSSSGASIFLAGNASDQYGGNLILKAYGAGSDGNHIIFENRSGTNTFSERMRIDSSGPVCIGTTAPIASSGDEKLFIQGSAGSDGYISAIKHTGNAGSNRDFIRFYNSSGTDIGAVEHTNTGSVTFSTSSDYRLKENVKPLEKGLERLLKLNPVKYDWKNTSETSEGFLAHEVQEAGWYEGVSGKKDDEKMQGMEYGKLTPLLVKAIQEQQTQIEALRSEINLLKGE